MCYSRQQTARQQGRPSNDVKFAAYVRIAFGAIGDVNAQNIVALAELGLDLFGQQDLVGIVVVLDLASAERGKCIKCSARASV